MKNIQVIDGADNATFSIFQATEEEFSFLFPGDQDLEFVEDLVERLGETRALSLLASIWERPILKRDAMGVHGTLFYDWNAKRHHLPKSKREVDWNDAAINAAQRRLFRAWRGRG